MNKFEELENKLKELSEEIEQLKTEKENEVWKPKFGENFWFLTPSGREKFDCWMDGAYQRELHAIGNVFRTQEEAEFRAEQIKVEAELRRFARPFDENKNNFQLIYSHLSHKVVIDSCTYILLTNMHFPSEEIAQKAIDTVGEERIKKYYFGVEE